MNNPQLIFKWYTTTLPKVNKAKPINRMAFVNFIYMHLCYNEDSVKLSDYASRFGTDAYEVRKLFKPFVDAGLVTEKEIGDSPYSRDSVYTISDKAYELAESWEEGHK